MESGKKCHLTWNSVCVFVCVCLSVTSIGYFQEVVVLLSLLSFLFNQISESETCRTGHRSRQTHTNTHSYLRSHICKLSLLFQREEIPSQPTPTGSFLNTSPCESVLGSGCVSTSGLLFCVLFSLQMLSVAFADGKEGKEGSVSLMEDKPEPYRRSYTSCVGHQAVKTVELLNPICNSAAKRKSHSAGHYFLSFAED